MDEYIQSLSIRDTLDVVPIKYVSGHNLLPGKWSLNVNREPYCTIRQFKEYYCVRRYLQNRLSFEPLNTYYLVIHWATVRLMFIF